MQDCNHPDQCDPTNHTTSEIVDIASESYQRLCMAVNLLFISNSIDARTAEGIKKHLNVMNGSLNIVASRAVTPEDIIG